jgi:predicted HTH domain antitoxin
MNQRLSMKTLCLEIPKSIFLSMKIPESEVPGRLKAELAIRLYQKGILGFGKARELAEMNTWQFQEILAKENIPVNYDVEELERDLETLRIAQ